VDQAAHRGRWGEDVHRGGTAQENGPYGDIVTGRGLEQVVGDAAAVQVRKDQEVRAAAQGAVGQGVTPCGLIERAVAVHLAVDLKVRPARPEQRQGVTHFDG